MYSHKHARWFFFIILLATAGFLPEAFGKDHRDKGKGGSVRFKGLDRNSDGRITRDEWRGNDRSFSVHDRNGDGVIEGDEVRSALRAEGYDDFLDIDRNRDGRIHPDEWRWDPAEFDRMDGDLDGSLTRREYLHAPSALPQFDNGAESSGALRWDIRGAQNALFEEFDLDEDGVISRTEWNGDKHSFARLDADRDDKLMRQEVIDRCHELEREFRSMDNDQSGRLSRQEWPSGKRTFGRLDIDHDDRLSPAEFAGMARVTRGGGVLR